MHGFNRKKAGQRCNLHFAICHQKQAQLILLADQKAQILSGLVLVVLTLLGTRLIYMEHGSFFCVHGTGNGDFTFTFFALRSLPLHWEF